MKKLITLVLVLVFIVALTACGKPKDSGEPVVGGAVSDISNSSTGTTEIEQPQPGDIETASGTVSHVGTEKTYELTAEEIEQIIAIMENGSWNLDGTADCANDCKLIINGRTYYYHSGCGTFNDNLNNQSLTTTDAEKESINAVLSQYITLGFEQPA